SKKSAANLLRRINHRFLRKDYRLAVKRGYNIELLEKVVNQLAAEVAAVSAAACFNIIHFF
ncbi:MAG: type II toxin-antitoxin system YafQ family toxin, partial [Clostridiales bacterium]|nr:type II toxin-antitoxin system YafQ family toxin [Clostridiales bacterium]